MTKTYYPDPVTVEVRIENQRMYLQFSTTINKLIKKSDKKKCVLTTKLKKVKRNYENLALTCTLDKPSYIYKLYGRWNHSLRFTEIREHMETRIWNSNNPHIWLYCTKWKISSLSLSIFNLEIKDQYVLNFNILL